MSEDRDAREARIEAVAKVLRAQYLVEYETSAPVSEWHSQAAEIVEALDALSPPVPLARAQEMERELRHWREQSDGLYAAVQLVEARAQRAEEAARDFAAVLAELAKRRPLIESSPGTVGAGFEQLGRNALARHPGFLPADEEPDA